MYKNEVTH